LGIIDLEGPMPEAIEKLVMWLIPLAPLAAAAVTAAFGPKALRERSHLPCWFGLAVSMVCSLVLLFSIVPQYFAENGGSAPIATGYKWIEVGGIDVAILLRADAMTAIMLAMVTSVSLLVAVFAAGYMHGDPGYARFYAEFSLFVFSMCMLVLAANFLLLFVFWEGVGLCSYLLIGFWYRRPSAAAAATKAFVVNRIGDFGLLIGIFLIWTTFGSLDFADVLDQPQRLADLAAAQPGRITAICLLLFLGAVGKSAQFPLHVWLPDAMEGPTPVSALIHAATMVTAGVYMVARCTPLFAHAPTAQLVVSGIGAVTALLAALIALTQFDLKRVLAYSTVSQLGYMFMALGAAAAASGGSAHSELATEAATAGMFHLFTHAFFKALLFLAAGSVMHAMGDVIDMRRFGGLRRALPITHWTFLCGAAALAGVPPLAGYWSKDEILAVLQAASANKTYALYFWIIFAVAAFTALLTAFYSFRAYFLTFWGAERFPDEAGHHPHEAPPVMAWPLRVLAVCAIGIGLVVGPTHWFAGYLHHAFGLAEVEAHGFHLSPIMVGSALIAFGGAALAWLFYVRLPELPGRVAASIGPLYQLSLNKFYLDEVYGAVFITPLKSLAWLSDWADRRIIDPTVDALGTIPHRVSRAPRSIHNGLVPSYALVMWTGLIMCLLFALGVFS
jgi:NADH-quinone oxidoreductase subunit L